jgi:hypothetical protein
MDERRQCPKCRTDVEAGDSACPFCGVALKTVPLPSAAPRGWAQRPTLKPCPDCGATVSVRAESCPQCGCPLKSKRGPTTRATLVSVLIGGLAMFVLFNMLTAGLRGAKAPLNAPRVAPGGRAVLDCKGGDGAYVAFGIEAWSKMAHAQVRRDTAEMERLVDAGQIALVADKTPVQVVGTGNMMHQVRVLDGPHKDRVGWVRREFVRPR